MRNTIKITLEEEDTILDKIRVNKKGFRNLLKELEDKYT